jgi:hypothetical protein
MPLSEKDKETQKELDLKMVLDTDYGRRVLWRLLQQAGLNDSVTEEDPAKPLPFEFRVPYNTGRQDFARWLERKLTVAHSLGVMLMRKEAEARFMQERVNA